MFSYLVYCDVLLSHFTVLVGKYNFQQLGHSLQLLPILLECFLLQLKWLKHIILLGESTESRPVFVSAGLGGWIHDSQKAVGGGVCLDIESRRIV